MEAAVVMRQCNQSGIPKLRKNRRIENKWGAMYYVAVNRAVFEVPSVPYMPSEPPPSLSEHVAECGPLYVCQQCKDCFRFQSSFEEHNARRSWILGYWCQHCFLTICPHVPAGSPLCSLCFKLDREKRSYLRTKGLRTSHKLGAIRVFYNQCQLFAHLKLHDLNSVDISDLMLMPLPSNIGTEWSSEIGIGCEALMEYAFSSRIHIMDWLKTEKVDKNWWILMSNNTEIVDNPVIQILRNYRGRHFFPLNTHVKQPLLSQLNFPNSALSNRMRCDSAIEDTKANVSANNTGDLIRNFKTCIDSDQNALENEDNPCTPTDIAFVDCGPAPKSYAWEYLISDSPKKRKKIYVKPNLQVANVWKPANISQANVDNVKFKEENTSMSIVPKLRVRNSKRWPLDAQLRKDCKYDFTKNARVRTENKPSLVIDDTLSKVPLKDGNKSRLPSMSESNISSSKKKSKLCTPKCSKLKKTFRSSTVNANSKVLTFQTPKNVDLNSIISRISPHIGPSKRIVVIEKGVDRVTVRSKADSVSGKKIQIVQKDAKISKNLKSKTPTTDSAESCNNTTPAIGNNVKKANVQRVPVGRKVIYRNGRKYIIKPSPGFNALSKVSTTVKNTSVVQNLVAKHTASTSETKDSNISGSTLTEEQAALLQDDISPLTPSPSPSELSTSSCEFHNKQQSVAISNIKLAENNTTKTSIEDHTIVDINGDTDQIELLSFQQVGKDGTLYLNIKRINRNASESVPVKVRTLQNKSSFINDFRDHTCSELKERIDHVESISEELQKIADWIGDSVVKVCSKFIGMIQEALREAMKCHQAVTGDTHQCAPNDSDSLFNKWESDIRLTEEFKCELCKKITKPKSYLPGFSKPAINDAIYCTCYKHVCHECSSYHGDASRFVAHQNFHKKAMPYMCPDCNRGFPSFNSLDLHVWGTCFHMLKKRLFGCTICGINCFQDIESISRHFAIMHCCMKFVCNKCLLVTSSYSECKKHYEELHSLESDHCPIKLAVCKATQCIIRCENFMSHIEKHPNVLRLIWFKCPFCLFSAVATKRVYAAMRGHLQSKHLQRLSEVFHPHIVQRMLPKDAKKLGTLNTTLFRKDNNKKKNAQEVAFRDAMLVPKIVNTRTITPEVFEHGPQGIEEDSKKSAKTPVLTEGMVSNGIKCNVRSLPAQKTLFSKNNDKNSESSRTLTPIKSNKTGIVPKILDVRSIAGLIPTDSKTTSNKNNALAKGKAVTKRSIKKLQRQNSLSRQSVIKAVEFLNAAKLDGKCTENGTKISDLEYATSNSKIVPTEVSVQNSNMCSEVSIIFDKHTPEITDTSNRASSINTREEEVSSNKSSILKPPPPLARIPRHIFESSKLYKPNEPQPENGRKRIITHKMHCKPPCRIALNSPTTSNFKPQAYKCHLCGELISTSWPVVCQHFKTQHSPDYRLSILSPRLLRMSSAFINGGYKELYCSGKKRKLDNVTSSAKRRRRWTPKKYTDGKSSNLPGLGLCVTQETAEDGDGNFKCKKCNQSCTDMSDLREHIARNHRIKGRYLICLECGENFVVAPSLQMHLKAFHGIDDPIIYMTQNTSYAPDITDDLHSEAKTSVANQCHVCMAVFEDKAAVDKHLRVHGMAFLNRKRIEARNALKSSEKSSTEEDKNPANESSKNPIKSNEYNESLLDKINAIL